VIITALLVLSVAAIVGFGVALAVRSKKEFAEQNQVVPGCSSPAPANWAGAHTREAKLHRSLGDAVKSAHGDRRFDELGLAAQMAGIDAQALAIDEHLVAAAALPEPQRTAMLDAIETHVVELERTIADLVMGVSVSDSLELLEQMVSTAEIRLQALAQARPEGDQVGREVSDNAGSAPATGSEAGDNTTDTGDEPGAASAAASS